jgi:hypothetical protein
MIRVPLRLALVVAVACSIAPMVSAQEDEPGLRVGASGVGTGIEDRELVGRSDRFDAGTDVVFWTRVEGGQPGDTVDHVWLREGEEVVTIALNVGGPSWRTWSRKTLHGSSEGSWTVEARDRDGRVLATATFTCTAEAPSGD